MERTSMRSSSPERETAETQNWPSATKESTSRASSQPLRRNPLDATPPAPATTRLDDPPRNDYLVPSAGGLLKEKVEPGSFSVPKLEEDLMEGPGTDADTMTGSLLSHLRKRTSQWPFPFSDRRFENEYWGFTEPLPFIAPIWMLLQMFNTYGPFSDAPPDVRTHPIGLAIHNLRIVVMSLGFFTAGVQLLLWLVHSVYLVLRQTQMEQSISFLSASTSFSTTLMDSPDKLRRRKGLGAPEGLNGSAPGTPSGVPAPVSTRPNSVFSNGSSTNVTGRGVVEGDSPGPSTGNPTHNQGNHASTAIPLGQGNPSRRGTNGSGSSLEQQHQSALDRFMTWLPTISHYIRVLQLYVMVLNCLASSLEGWNSVALSTVVSWQRKYKGRIPTLLPFFPSAYILRASLTWEIPRLLAFPIIETVLPFSDINTQPPEGVFTHIFVAWVLAALFIFMLWEAERESRLRFLTYKALLRLKVLSQRRKEKIQDMLESLCEKESLTNLLSGQIVRDDSANCAILVTTIHDFQLWRLHSTIFQAVNCIDHLYEEIETLRTERFTEIDVVSFFGDTYIVSCGLVGDGRSRTKTCTGLALDSSAPPTPSASGSTYQCGRLGAVGLGSESNASELEGTILSPTEQPVNPPLLAPILAPSALSQHPSGATLPSETQRTLPQVVPSGTELPAGLVEEEEMLDPSELVLFASQVLSLPRWLQAKERLRRFPGKATLSLLGELSLRMGFGFGACSGGILPVRGLPYVIEGEALDEANAAVLSARPNCIELPKSVVQHCKHISITHLQRPQEQQTPKDANLFHSEEKIRITNVRRRRRPRLALSSAQSTGSIVPMTAAIISSDGASNRSGTEARRNSVGLDGSRARQASSVDSALGAITQESESSIPTQVEALVAPLRVTTSSVPTTHSSLPSPKQEVGRQESACGNAPTLNAQPRVERHPQNSAISHAGSGSLPNPLGGLITVQSPRAASERGVEVSFGLGCGPLAEEYEDDATGVKTQSQSGKPEQQSQCSSIIEVLTNPTIDAPTLVGEGIPAAEAQPPEETQQRTRAMSELLTAAKEFLLLFHPILEPDFCAWVDMRLAQRRPMITAVWTVLWLVYAIPYFHEAAFTPTADIYIGLGAGVIVFFELYSTVHLRQCRRQNLSTLSPVVGASPPSAATTASFMTPLCAWILPLRVQVFLLGTLSFIFVQGACITSKMFTFGPTRFPVLIWNFAFGITSTDGLPLLLTLGVSLALALVGVRLGSFASRAVPGTIIIYFIPLILVLVKAIAIRKEFKQLKIFAELQRKAEIGRQTHENLLNLILPSYIISHISNIEERDTKQAVSDAIGDVAMLLVKFPSFLSGGIEQKFVLLSRISEFVQRQKDISLLHTDGDVAMICGPLARPDDAECLPKELSSTSKQRSFRRRLLESVANEASLSALLTLNFVLRLFRSFQARPTAVVSRSDGVAVVFRRRRPVFSIEGRIAEQSRAILSQIAPGSLCFTKDFLAVCPIKLTEFPAQYGLHPVTFSRRGSKQPLSVAHHSTRIAGSTLAESSVGISEPPIPDSELTLAPMRLRGIGYLEVVFMSFGNDLPTV